MSRPGILSESKQQSIFKFNQKMARGLAWAAWSISMLLILSATVIWFLDGGNLRQGGHIILTGIAFACFGTVGALIISQRPDNTIGWIFCSVGIGTGITDFSGAYSTYSTIHGHVLLPGSGIFNWLGDTCWPLNWSLMLVFLPLLFPNGHPLTRRWRIVGWLAAIMTSLAVLINQVAYIGGALSGDANFTTFWVNQGSILNILQLPLTIAAFVSLILRFIRARERERQQIKWLAYGVIILVVLVIGTILFLNDNSPLSQYLFDIAIMCLPLSIGISILCAQLYDIDRLISRTLIYLLLSALLVLTYLALVFGLQFTLQGITQNSPVPIVVSTLTVAALFQSLRRAIQQVIDRSFYRRKYNAEKVLTRFGATLHNEIDLTQLSQYLLAVVQETMQPEHVSLWLCAKSQPEQEKAV
ncbi:hypothetical protein [Ktedonobacter racemifer]|uniref:Uncharacterized protein n=1 Tax=Ktedonobacter racemifer DSM 44963 TaxID=485913 RepID=D6TXH0_KTERA|nr:hypothetical protein [Ktedonobacter racemifer]EFH84903.1 hypothetical protein Krac_6021 [Ktedonobacter racemifer DSM 44963]